MLIESLPARFLRSFKLTPRELEVTNILVHGMTNKETTRELRCSPRTVEDHRLVVFRKLGALQLRRGYADRLWVGGGR
jgi:DNA-binding CsgD family transcriptional regulator